MRKIEVINTADASLSKSFESDATTYGQIKNELGVAPGSMKVVVRETKVTLEADDAVLPEGDFTLYLFPGKVKSGWDDYDAADEDDVDYEAQTKLDTLNAKLNIALTTIDTLFAILTVPAEQRQEVAAKVNAEAERKNALLAEAEELRKQLGY